MSRGPSRLEVTRQSASSQFSALAAMSSKWTEVVGVLAGRRADTGSASLLAQPCLGNGDAGHGVCKLCKLSAVPG
jgi:hypothetical protein